MTDPMRMAVRLEATVMFADLSGFTALAERLDPEVATELVNRCFAAMETIVHAHGGIVDQYIGDCLKAFWSDAAGGAAPAVRAALAIREVVARLGEGESLGIHVGLACGEVVAGDMGGQRRHFSVLGDVVTIAQRLGESSESGDILADRATQRAAGVAFSWRPLPPVRIINRAEPLAAAALAGADGAANGRGALVAAAMAAGRGSGTGALELGAVRRGSERRQATVVFAEVLGLEPLVDAMTPERFTTLLNRCLEAFEPAVSTAGGVIDKFMGATVMALFGVPNAIEHAPRQALLAVLDMQRRLRAFSDQHGLAGTLHLRAGVNGGLLIAGEIGGPTTRAFTVIGDAANVAARLKEAAPPDAVLVGQETQRAAADSFVFTALPPRALKGKASAVAVWQLAGERAVEGGRPDGGTRAISSALVGRADELARIAGAVGELTRGQGGIVAVVGEAGIGKSRLMSEARALPALASARVLEGRSLANGRRAAFHPFVDLLQRWAGISKGDAPDEAAAKLARAVRTLMPEEFDDVMPFVARLMGLLPPPELAAHVAGIAGAALEELLFKAMRDLIGRLAAAQPVVLLFEDLHWADQSSIKLLEGLLRLVTTAPLLIILVGRPAMTDTLERVLATARAQYKERLVEVPLRRLSDAQCDDLIRNLLRTDALPYATRALVARKAEGNPFFIEEVLRSFIDRGLIEYRGGRFHLTAGIETVEVPGTIDEVIMSRVDRLDEATRHVLQVAAVIGRSFYHRVLADVLADEALLTRAMAELTEKQLVRERRTHRTATVRRKRLEAEREYQFTHALAQDAVYASLLQRTRRELHRRVAASFERQFADRLADVYGMLAYHYSHAEVLGRAEEYLFRAGEEAARAAASAEALTFFRDASDLYLRLHGDGGDPRKKAQLEKNIGLALFNTGALTESIDHFDRAQGHLGVWAPRHPLTAGAWFALNFVALMAQLYLGLGRHRRIRDWDAERALCEIWFNRGRAEITSDPTRLFFDTVRAFRYFNEIDAARIEQASAMYASAAAVFCYSGISFDVSRRAIARANRLIRPGNVRDEFTVRSMEFILEYLAGDWRRAPVIDPAFVDAALRSGLLWDVNTYVGLYCDLLLRQGRFPAARAELARLAELNDAYGYGFAGTNHDAMRMLLLLEERRLPDALHAAEHYQRARHEDALKVLGLGSKAKAQVLLGDLAGAGETLAAAERITRRSRTIPPWHLSAFAAARLRNDAALLAARPDQSTLRRSARRSLRHAAHLARKVGIQRTEVYQLCGQVCWLLGHTRAAARWWERSLACGREMGAEPELARTQALIAAALSDTPSARVGGLDAAAHRVAARARFEGLALEADLAELARDGAARAA